MQGTRMQGVHGFNPVLPPATALHDTLYVALLGELTPGQAVAQTAHVVAAAGSHGNLKDNLRRWAAKGRVVVVAGSPEELERLWLMGPAAQFWEPDLGDQRTAVAFFTEDPEILAYVKKLRLYGEP